MTVRINFYIDKKRTTTTINSTLARYFCSALMQNTNRYDGFKYKKKDNPEHWEGIEHDPEDWIWGDDNLRKSIQNFINEQREKGLKITSSEQIDDILCKYIFDFNQADIERKRKDYADFINSRSK